MKLFLMSAVLIGSLWWSPSHHKFEKTLNEQVQKAPATIDLTSLAEFKWDKAYVFGPYTSKEALHAQLGVKFPGVINMERRDDIYLFVFLYKKKVIEYAQVNRRGINIAIDRTYLTPRHSSFMVTSGRIQH